MASPEPMPQHLQVRRVTGRRVLIVVVVAILAIFLPPLFTLKSYSGRIASAMERALGRRVTVGQVSLRLLPQPGFELKKLVIFDDPAFGAEPMLRADDVAANLYLSSLWRGRLEISRLTLKSGFDISPASLNLVRAADGRWNIEALLRRASQTPAAPTAQVHSEARPRFPYIEASGARINLKIGNEKTVYALMDADFALWLAAENEWAFRLSARPVRTDSNMSDTGTLKVSGRFRRAATLRETPLDVSASLQNAQLGQLTKLLYGHDRGWRGAVEWNAHLKGTPAALQVSTSASVREFRRYDIDIPESLRLDARCDGNYSTATARLSDLDCRLPIGNGAVLARGSSTGFPRPSAYDVNIFAEGVNLQAVVALARRAKKDLPNDLAVTGTFDSSFHLRKGERDPAPTWTGSAETSKAVLRSRVLASELPLSPMTFRLVGPSSKRNGNLPPAATAGQNPGPWRLEMEPVAVPLGGSSPVQVRGWFGKQQYAVEARGEARFARLLQVGQALGLRVPQSGGDGMTKVDVRIAGKWSGFGAPLITGNAQLRNVNLPVNGLNSPLQLTNAEITLTSASAMVRNLKAHFPGSSLQVTGTLRRARNCDRVEQCPVQFDLHSDEISVDALNHLLNPGYTQRPWYDVFGGRGAAPILKRLQASGRIRASLFLLRSVQAKHLSANVRLSSGTAVITQLQADLLGGHHEGEWRADFTRAEPSYTGTGTFSGVAMAQVAALMHDHWADGTAGATYKLALSGRSADELVNSAEGVASFAWHNGTLHHLTLEDSGPLRFSSFVGELQLHAGVIQIAESKMTARSGIYSVSGTASLDRQLGLKLQRGQHSYVISGPLDRPKSSLVSPQRAFLKP